MGDTDDEKEPIELGACVKECLRVGHVYEIVGTDDATGETKRYIGSTYRPLGARLVAHRSDLKVHLATGKKSISSFAVLQMPRFEIQCLGCYPGIGLLELRQKEQAVIEAVECVNKVSAFRSAEKDRACQRKWYQSHQSEQCARAKATYHRDPSVKAAQYQAHRAERLARAKQRYWDNREAVLEKARRKRQGSGSGGSGSGALSEADDTSTASCTDA